MKQDKKKYEIYLETERLILRNVSESDKDFLINLWTIPEVTEYMEV